MSAPGIDDLADALDIVDDHDASPVMRLTAWHEADRRCPTDARSISRIASRLADDPIDCAALLGVLSHPAMRRGCLARTDSGPHLQSVFAELTDTARSALGRLSRPNGSHRCVQELLWTAHAVLCSPAVTDADVEVVRGAVAPLKAHRIPVAHKWLSFDAAGQTIAERTCLEQLATETDPARIAGLTRSWRHSSAAATAAVANPHTAPQTLVSLATEHEELLDDSAVVARIRTDPWSYSWATNLAPELLEADLAAGRVGVGEVRAMLAADRSGATAAAAAAIDRGLLDISLVGDLCWVRIGEHTPDVIVDAIAARTGSIDAALIRAAAETAGDEAAVDTVLAVAFAFAH